MIRRPPRSTPKPSSAASDVYKRQILNQSPEHKDALSSVWIKTTRLNISPSCFESQQILGWNNYRDFPYYEMKIGVSAVEKTRQDSSRGNFTARASRQSVRRPCRIGFSAFRRAFWRDGDDPRSLLHCRYFRMATRYRSVIVRSRQRSCGTERQSATQDTCNRMFSSRMSREVFVRTVF